VASKPVRTSGDPVPAARLSRSVTEVVTAPVPGLELPGLRECSFAVVDNGSGVAAPLVEELRRHGVTAHVTASPAPGARGLILLGGLRPVDSAKDAVEVNRQAFATVREAASSATGPDVLVTVQDTGGDFGLGGTAGNRAWLGGLSGLARTVAKERPDTVVKAVDCERGGRTPQELARVLAQELLYGGAGTDVGLRADGSRWVLGERQQEAPGPRTAPPTPRRVGSDSVIVATGGARGVTAAALIALAKEQQPTFVLLGRTELAEEPEDLSTAPDETELKRRIAARPTRPGAARPGPAAIGAEAARVLAAREVRATIAALEAAGSTVRYVPVDARNAQALGDVLQQVRTEVGAVTGLVHAAGVLADARIEDKSDEQFHAVFDTKAEGLRVLLDATAQDPLELVCVFSSVAGRFGNTGQSDYAMANEVLAQVASGVAAQRPDCVVRSLAWGPWDGGMVGSALREHFRSTGVDLIPLQEGAAAFVRELEGGPGPVRVTLVAGERPDALGSGSGGVALGALRVAADTRPHLADHAIAGTPVVPMALVLEWFTAAVRDQAPGSRPVLLRDVEVVRGVSLPDHRGSGHLVTVRATRESAADPALCLTLENGARTHYRATADTGPDRPQPARNWHLPAGRSARARVYGEGVLFHGPAFHGLTEVTVGADGAAARVRGMRALDWPPADGRHTDPAAVDAGLQLALLWAEEACGAAFLPMGAGEVRVHAYGPLTEPASGVVLAREVDPLRPVCDLALLDGDGTPLVELLGVSLVRRPDTPVAAEPVQPSTEDRN
jgi:NADP-dependent 3-hydroxy acid dehydrogenase YdfG